MSCSFAKVIYMRRPVVLLEVLIAFALVVLCALPMIYPHIFILKSEKEFIASVELDHLVNLLYANRVQKLYQNEIPWADIEGGKELPIESSMLEEVAYNRELSFIGTYRFVKVKCKPAEPTDQAIYLYQMLFVFLPKKGFFKEAGEKPPTYSYLITIERRLK